MRTTGRRLTVGLVVVSGLALAFGGGVLLGRELEDDAHDPQASAAPPPRVVAAEERIQETLADAEQELPAATQAVTQRFRTETGATPESIGPFLEQVIASVDRYWTQTLVGIGLSGPVVSFTTVAPGERVQTGCQNLDRTPAVADDHAAFYCPTDDTIYIAERFATELWQGINADLPGTQAGYGRAVGDFGVAYVVAHEFAHNVQQDVGYPNSTRPIGTRDLELQADCMAGLWGNSVYHQGLLDPGDVEEAISTALAAGDFDIYSAGHHGTPDERREAWTEGFGGGDPTVCNRFLTP